MTNDVQAAAVVDLARQREAIMARERQLKPQQPIEELNDWQKRALGPVRCEVSCEDPIAMRAQLEQLKRAVDQALAISHVHNLSLYEQLSSMRAKIWEANRAIMTMRGKYPRLRG